MAHLPRRSVLLLPLLLLLQPALACGRSAPATTRPAPETALSETALSETAPSETVPGGATVAAVEERVGELVNRERRRAGVGELVADRELARIARRHSRHMRDAGFFDHVAPDGTGLVDRLRQAGVDYRAVAENVAQVGGYPEPAAALHRTLMDSPGHRRNLLDGRFGRVGIGVAREGDRWWLTQVFLRPYEGSMRDDG